MLLPEYMVIYLTGLLSLCPTVHYSKLCRDGQSHTRRSQTSGCFLRRIPVCRSSHRGTRRSRRLFSGGADGPLGKLLPAVRGPHAPLPAPRSAFQTNTAGRPGRSASLPRADPGCAGCASRLPRTIFISKKKPTKSTPRAPHAITEPGSRRRADVLSAVLSAGRLRWGQKQRGNHVCAQTGLRH